VIPVKNRIAKVGVGIDKEVFHDCSEIASEFLRMIFLTHIPTENKAFMAGDSREEKKQRCQTKLQVPSG
jgi:hypothetical protein